jgi:hypothetical protein
VKKLAMLVAASSLVLAVPAWATKPPHPVHPTHPSHPSHGNGKGKCTARNEGYNARGTLVGGSLAPATTKDHYDGTLTVDVKRANHKAPDGVQSFTLTDARVRFGKGVTSTTLATVDRVLLHGKITVLPHKCASGGSSPTITIRNVTIKGPKS